MDKKTRIAAISILLILCLVSLGIRESFDAFEHKTELRSLEILLGPRNLISPLNTDVYISVPDNFISFVFNFTFTQINENYTFDMWLPFKVATLSSMHAPEAFLSGPDMIWGARVMFPKARAAVEVLPASSQALIPSEWRVLYHPRNTTYWHKASRYYDQLTVQGHFFAPAISDQSYSHQSFSLPIFADTLEQISRLRPPPDHYLGANDNPIYMYPPSSLSLSIELNPGYDVIGTPSYLSGTALNDTKTVAQFELTRALQTRSLFGSQGIKIQLDSVSHNRDQTKTTFQNVSLLFDALAIGTIIALAFQPSMSRRKATRISPNVHTDIFQSRMTPIGFYDFQLPKVGFEISNDLTITARVTVSIYLGDQKIGIVDDRHGYYSGDTTWEQKPGTFWGNFSIPAKCKESSQNLRLQVDLTLTDNYKKTHTLTRCFTYDRQTNKWFPEPASFENLLKRAREKGYDL